MIRLIYFASLRTIAGKDEETLDLDQETNIQQLGERIRKTTPQIGEMILGKKIMVAVNQDVAQLDTVVKDGDEIAFLPPFSGGTK